MRNDYAYPSKEELVADYEKLKTSPHTELQTVFDWLRKNFDDLCTVFLDHAPVVPDFGGCFSNLALVDEKPTLIIHINLINSNANDDIKNLGQLSSVLNGISFRTLFTGERHKTLRLQAALDLAQWPGMSKQLLSASVYKAYTQPDNYEQQTKAILDVQFLTTHIFHNVTPDFLRVAADLGMSDRYGEVFIPWFDAHCVQTSLSVAPLPSNMLDV